MVKKIPLDECIFGIYDYIVIFGPIGIVILSALFHEEFPAYGILIVAALVFFFGWSAASALCVKMYVRKMGKTE